MTKRLGLVSFMVVVLMILIGCSPNMPRQDEMKQDLTEQSFYLHNGRLEIESVDEITEFTLTEDTLDKDSRTYQVEAHIELEKEYLIISSNIYLEYLYVPNEGWNLTSADIDRENTSVKLTGNIQDEVVEQAISNETLILEDYGKWWNLDDIEQINIISQEYLNEELEALVTIELVSKNDVEELTATVLADLKLNISDETWEYWKLEVISSSLKLHSGISKDNMIKLLDNVSLSNVIKIEFDGKTEFLGWKISDLEEIKNFEILESVPYYEDYRETHAVQIELEKNNISCKGILYTSYIYSNDRWRLEDVKIADSFEYKLITDLDTSIESLGKLLSTESFLYSGYFWGDEWKFSEGTIEKLDVSSVYPTNYGKTVILLTNMELANTELKIAGDATITLKLDDSNNWYVYSIKKEEDFIEELVGEGI